MNNKQDNKFFNTEAQNNMNYSRAEQDRKEFKYNNEVLPPLQQNTGQRKINRFYVNVKFPFFKYIIFIVIIVGIVFLVYHLPYNKLRESGDKYCLVILDYGDIYSEKILCGSKFSRPEDPYKEGDSFVGWYQGDELYNFDTTVTGNVTLVAKWSGDMNSANGSGG